MPDAIDIPFSVSGQEELVKALVEGAAASERAADALEKQSRSAKATTSAYAGLTRSQSAVKSSGSSRPMRYVSGPSQRQTVLQSQLAHATAAGDASAISDIGRAIVRNEKQLAGKNPPPFEKRLETLIRSTRIGVGGPGAGGVFPLVGQLQDLLGPELGPFGAIIGSLTKGAELFSQALTFAADAGNKFGQLQTSAGTDAKTAGILSNLGISASDAAAFNNAITTDPTAIGFAGRANISNAPGAYGSQNTGREIVQALTYLRTLPKEEAIREANGMQIGDLYSRFAQLSDASFRQRVGPDASLQAGTFNSQYTQDAAEYTNAKDRLSEAVNRNFSQIFGSGLSATAKISNELATYLSHSHPFKLDTSPRNFFDEKLKPDEDKYGNPLDPKAALTKENTEALKANTQQIGIGQRQYGHGDRTDAAIPRGFGIGSGNALRRDLQAGAMRLGAFG